VRYPQDNLHSPDQQNPGKRKKKKNGKVRKHSSTPFCRRFKSTLILLNPTFPTTLFFASQRETDAITSSQ
jgi:hypothetical protein